MSNIQFYWGSLLPGESFPLQQGPCMCMWESPVLRQPEKLHFRHERGSETSPAANVLYFNTFWIISGGKKQEEGLMMGQQSYLYIYSFFFLPK